MEQERSLSNAQRRINQWRLLSCTRDENPFSEWVQLLRRPIMQCIVAAPLVAGCSAEPGETPEGETPTNGAEIPTTTSREEPKSPVVAANTIPIANALDDTTHGHAQTAVANPERDGVSGPRWVVMNDPSDWTYDGNSPATVRRLGTNNNLAFEIEVNDQRAMRYVPIFDSSYGHIPNLIGGSGSNAVTGPNGGNTIGGGHSNEISGHFSTIAGGLSNDATREQATVSGGHGNLASGVAAAVGGGTSNTASGHQATVPGGAVNTAQGSFATIGGGNANMAAGEYSSVPGGRANNAAGHYSFTAGNRLEAIGDHSVAVGSCNAAFGGPGWVNSDPLLLVGNGVPGTSGCTSRSNALTVLKNGNMGVGVPLFWNGASRVEIQANTNTSVYTHLHLHESQADDYARLSFGNTTTSNHWMIAARPQGIPQTATFGLWYGGVGNVLNVTGEGRLWLNSFFPSSSTTALCASSPSGAAWIGRCSSSARYKKDIKTFAPGLEIIEHLRSVSFTSTSTGERDLGFIAEEVAKVHPLLATYDERGRPESVRYMELTAVLSNAIQEQQKTIRSHERELDQQRNRLATLEAMVEKQARLLEESMRAMSGLKEAVTALRTSPSK
jgi:hypothetical protein